MQQHEHVCFKQSLLNSDASNLMVSRLPVQAGRACDPAEAHAAAAAADAANVLAAASAAAAWWKFHAFWSHLSLGDQSSLPSAGRTRQCCPCFVSPVAAGAAELVPARQT